jgi:hypothetical protein
MHATDTLHGVLRYAGVRFCTLGSNVTLVEDPGGWKLVCRDNYDGTLNVGVSQVMLPSDVLSFVTREQVDTAEIHTQVSDEGTHGHSECGKCGHTVNQSYHYCPWCGARFMR